MKKETEILTSSPLRNQLDASLKEKKHKTGNLTPGVTCTEKININKCLTLALLSHT
jgi:hypothetical protein